MNSEHEDPAPQQAMPFDRGLRLRHRLFPRPRRRPESRTSARR
jgi:hypothetical protein